MIRFYVHLLLCIVIPLAVCEGQNQRTVDSLESIILNGKDDYEPLHRLVVAFAGTNKSKALDYAVRAERAALRTGDTLYIRKSKRVKAQILLQLGRPMDALSAIQLYAKDRRWFVEDEEQLMLSNAMGVCHLMMGQFDQALEYYLQVSQLADKLKNTEYEKVSQKNIGVTYYKLKAYEKALDYLLRGLELEKAIGEVNVFSRINISLCYAHLRNFAMARRFLDEGIQACGSECGSEPLTHIKYAAGCLAYNMGRLSDGKEAFATSLALARKDGDHRMMLDNISLLAKIAVQTGHISEAEFYLKEAEKVIHQGAPFNLEIIKIYEQLSSLYLQTRNLGRAFDYQSKYIRFRDSLYNEVVITHLMNLESEYLEKANEAKIAEQRKLLAMSEEMISRQKAVNILAGITVALSLVIIVILFSNYQRKKWLNAVLDQKVSDRTAELERSRRELYKELHLRELSTNRMAVKVAEKFCTIKGLCQTAREETSGAGLLAYLDRIEKTFEEIRPLLIRPSSER